MSSTGKHALQEMFDAARWRLRSFEDIRSTSWFTLSNYMNVFLFLIFVALAIYQARSKIVSQHPDRYIIHDMPNSILGTGEEIRRLQKLLASRGIPTNRISTVLFLERRRTFEAPGFQAQVSSHHG